MRAKLDHLVSISGPGCYFLAGRMFSPRIARVWLTFSVIAHTAIRLARLGNFVICGITTATGNLFVPRKRTTRSNVSVCCSSAHSLCSYRECEGARYLFCVMKIFMRTCASHPASYEAFALLYATRVCRKLISRKQFFVAMSRGHLGERNNA